MILFSELDKANKDHILPIMFDILYQNMNSIAPSNLSYQKEKENYISTVSRAMNRDSRKVLLCTDNDSIVGYIQYYTSDDLLMIEEVQIIKRLQKTLLFYKMCRHLANTLPLTIRYIEAYADKRNIYSQRLMQKIGMKQTKTVCDPAFVHLRGNCAPLRKRFS